MTSIEGHPGYLINTRDLLSLEAELVRIRGRIAQLVEVAQRQLITDPVQVPITLQTAKEELSKVVRLAEVYSQAAVENQG